MGRKPRFKPNQFVMCRVEGTDRLGVIVSSHGPTHWKVVFDGNELQSISDGDLTETSKVPADEGKRLRGYAKARIAELTDKQYPTEFRGTDALAYWRNQSRRRQ